MMIPITFSGVIIGYIMISADGRLEGQITILPASNYLREVYLAEMIDSVSLTANYIKENTTL